MCMSSEKDLHSPCVAFVARTGLTSPSFPACLEARIPYDACQHMNQAFVSCLGGRCL